MFYQIEATTSERFLGSPAGNPGLCGRDRLRPLPARARSARASAGSGASARAVTISAVPTSLQHHRFAAHEPAPAGRTGRSSPAGMPPFCDCFQPDRSCRLAAPSAETPLPSRKSAARPEIEPALGLGRQTEQAERCRECGGSRHRPASRRGQIDLAAPISGNMSFERHQAVRMFHVKRVRRRPAGFRTCLRSRSTLVLGAPNAGYARR